MHMYTKTRVNSRGRELGNRDIYMLRIKWRILYDKMILKINKETHDTK